MPGRRVLGGLVASLQLFSSCAAPAPAACPAPPPQSAGLEYDYVVVGSGPGGATIASRLSEDASVSVAVIEAGPWTEEATGNQSQIPAFDFFYTGKDPADTNAAVEWGFVTTPQKGIDGRATHYTRGKSVGGSSNLHYMAYTHTSKGALARWADAVGDAAYRYENAERLYRKSVTHWAPADALRFANATPQYDFAPDAAGTGGPLDVSYANYAQPWATWIARGMAAVGIPNVQSFVNGKLLGSAWLTSTIDPRSGRRDSAATAFLQPYLVRPNLHVFDQTRAEKVLFDAARRATGVRATNATSTYTFAARREVIVAGGAFQSPQLLMVSGVGPKQTLDRYSIDVVADRPGVGRGLTDHIYYGIGYRVNVKTTSALQYGTTAADAAAQWNANGSGLLSSPGGDYVAFEKLPAALRTSFSKTTAAELKALPADWPELQYVSLPAFAGDLESSSAGSPQDGFMYATLLTALVAPSSAGDVSISSASTSDPPVINPNWLTTQRDIDLVIAGFKRLRQILETSEVDPVTIGPEYYPGSSVKTDAQILDQIKKSFNTMFHAAASCKMGKPTDKYAVVDSHARVYGVSKLRVVDASAFPFLPPGLPQSTVYMLAEKIAEDIKKGQ